MTDMRITTSQDVLDAHLDHIDKLEADNKELVSALEGQERIIHHAQQLLTMYLEPGDHRIQTPEDAINSLLSLFDGPSQREAQEASTTALAKHRSTS